MRFWCSIVSLLLSLTAFYSADGQTPSAFQQQAQAAVSAGKSFSVVNLTATAEWTAGSDHESGTAQLQANVDGSTKLQLNVGKASRTEVQTKADSSRTCTWTNSAGTSHDIVGPNCFIAVPWFSPSLFTQPSSGLPALLATTDDGPVTKDSATLHQVSYLLRFAPANSASTSASTSTLASVPVPVSTSTNRMVGLSTVKVFYDPQTFLPASLEYSVHPDNNDSLNIPVKVVFSNYQSASGVMLPYHIERFVNNTLLLKLDVTNASIE